VSESPTYLPLVIDVNPTLYPGSSSDFRNGSQGRERVFVIGAAGTGITYAPIDTTGLRSSRALQTNTDHYVEVTCPNASGGHDVATLVARTANIAPGDTFPQPYAPVDPAHPGDNAYPDFDFTDKTGRIDPISGTFIQKFPLINSQRGAANGYLSLTKAWDASGNWVNRNNVLADDSSVATFTGSTNDPLLLTHQSSQTPQTTITGVSFRIHAFVDNVTTTAEVCMVVDGVNCYGPWIAIPALPVGALGAYKYAGDPDVYQTPTNISTNVAMWRNWLSVGQPVPDVTIRQGRANNTGPVLKLFAQDLPDGRPGKAFGTNWTAGTHITYNGVDYVLASSESASQVTLAATPAADTTQTVWTSDTVGFKIRKSSVGGTLTVDHVGFIYITYAGPIANNGGAFKQCTNKRYPEGWNIGVRANGDGVTKASGQNIVIHTGMAHDFVTGDVVKQIDVPGWPSAIGTFTVTRIDSTHYSLDGTSGAATGTYPNTGPSDFSSIFYVGGGLAWKVNAPTGYLCFITDQGAGKQFYWINDQTTPADIRYLGPSYLVAGNGWPGGGTGVNASGTVDETDPDVPLLFNMVTIAGKQEILRGKYKGNEFVGMFRAVNTDQEGGQTDASNIWKWSRLTPPPNTLTDKFAAFDPVNAALGLIPAAFALDGIPDPGIMSFHAYLGSQNSLGWVGVYDTTTNTVLGLVNSWSQDNMRWGGLHINFLPSGTGQMILSPYQLHTPTEAYRGPYNVTATNALNATPTDCDGLLMGFGLTNVTGVTGSHCSMLTINTLTPITPPGANPAGHTLNGQTIAIGDWIGFDDDTTGPTIETASEFVRVLGISGLNLVVERDKRSPELLTGLQAHLSGATLYMFSGYYISFWHYGIAPHGSTGTDPYSTGLQSSGIYPEPVFVNQSHGTILNGFYANDSGSASNLTPPFTCAAGPGAQIYAMRNWPWPNHVNAPRSAYGCTDGNPSFDGKYGNGFGNDLEKHPSVSYNAVLANNMSFWDYRVYAPTVAWEGAITKVGTYVYRKTGLNSGQSVNGSPPFDEKRNRVFNLVGTKTVLDVSAPGLILDNTTAGHYTSCTAHVAGECWASSLAGDVYTNAPKVATIPLGLGSPAGTYGCHGKWLSTSDPGTNDICVAVQPAYADQIVQHDMINDPTNDGARRITNAFNMPRRTNLITNAPALPDGNWVFGETVYYKDIMQSLLFLVKVPPYPGKQKGANRGSWIPIPVKLTSVPTDTNNVVVEFGYNPSFWCTTRRESCIANAASITSTIYNYSVSDTYSGLACSSGCTPVIPALSQRVLWYRVKYRNASNALIKTGEVQVLATP
jgi:hypothetical protein